MGRHSLKIQEKDLEEMIDSINTFLARIPRGIVISAGFALFMLLGAGVLMLPACQTGREPLRFIDALFTSVSAVSVTGLSIVDYDRAFSIPGQLVILIMSQVGGLGIMTIMAAWGITTGRKIRLAERLLIRDSFNLQTPSGMVGLVKKIAIMTVFIETVSGILLSIYFVGKYGWIGIYYGFWHAVAAFCNTGLDILGGVGGFSSVASSPYAMTIFLITMELGGLGFVVMDDIYRKRNWKRLTLNSKVTIFTGVILIIAGTVLFYLIERNNLLTLGNETGIEKLFDSLFMSVSARTSGFSVIDMEVIRPATALLIMVFMVIGSGPVSTGGGIRTTTLAVLFMSVFSWIRGHHNVVIFHKRIANKILYKALNIFCIHTGFIILTTFCMLLFDTSGFTFQQILFESVSAFSTVGFSMGITDGLNDICKMILIVAMFIGRIGVMTLVITFEEKSPSRLKYPVENITIG